MPCTYSMLFINHRRRLLLNSVANLYLQYTKYNVSAKTTFLCRNFLGGIECVGHCFAYLAHFVFLRDVWIRTQKAAVASRRAIINLATHLYLPPPSLQYSRYLMKVSGLVLRREGWVTAVTLSYSGRIYPKHRNDTWGKGGGGGLLFCSLLWLQPRYCVPVSQCFGWWAWTFMNRHAQSCTVMYCHAQSCTVMYSHVLSCTVMYCHAQSCTVMHSHVLSSTRT